MHLYKVKDLSKLELGKGKILVEFVRKPEGTIILADQAADSPDNLLRMEVVATAHDEIPVGALIVEARFARGMSEGTLKFNDRVFMVAFGQDVALWTTEDNFDESAKEQTKEIKTSKIIQ